MGIERLENRILLAVGVNVNVSRMPFDQSEVNIAVNPANPLNLIASANDIGFGAQDSTWFTRDGGQTWTRSLIPNIGTASAGGDPTTVFDRTGVAYYAHLNLTNNSIPVARSTDGGQTWTAVNVTTATAAFFIDKEFLSVGPDVNDLTRDRIYLGYHANNIQFVQSSLDGITWSAPVRVQDSGAGINEQIAVDANGIAYMAWQELGNPQAGFSRIFFDRSLDGGLTWGTDSVAYTSNVAAFNDVPGGRQYTVPMAPLRGIAAFLSIDADRSSGPNRGNIYLSIVDQGDLDGNPNTGHNNTDIFVIRSSDQGQTWSAPVRVNDDVTQNTQAIPWLAVDQTSGDLALGWYDARNDTGNRGPGDTDGIRNDDAQYFVGVSQNGGLTFQNFQMSQGTFNSRGKPNDYGEYSGVAFYNNTVYAVWSDNSNSTGDNPDGTLRGQDVYFNTLQVIGGVKGTVFNDFNGDGTRNLPGDVGLPNWTIFADQNGNGVLDSGTRTFQVPKPIQDQQTTTAAISVQKFLGTLTDVNVTLNIAHPNDADLAVTLISPSGKRVKLFSNVGGTGDNFSNTTFDDQATATIGSGSAPFTGTFRPTELLSTFNGDDPNGIWLLEITDSVTGNQGTLNGWTLNLSSTQEIRDFKSQETPQFLRDLRTTDSTLYVSGFSGDITNVQVNLDITHTYDHDLTAVLISPSGTSVTLFSGVGGSGHNFTNTTFDDSATNSIQSSSSVVAPPFTGSFKPKVPLATLKSENPNGLWTLRISDNRSLDEGFLNNWSLAITTSEPSTTTDASGNFDLKLPNAGTYLITEVPQTGWKQTAPGGNGSQSITITQGQVVTGVLFGNTTSNAAAPVLFLPTAAATYTENAPAVVIDPGARVEDANSANFNGGTLTVTLGARGTVNDRLEIGNQGTGIGQFSLVGPVINFAGQLGSVTIGNYSGGNGTTPLSITLNANATPSLTTALLRDITFRTLGDNPSTAPRTVQFSLTDAPGGNTATLSTSVNVVAVNDAPVNSLPTPLTISKNASVTIGGIGGTTPISVSDVDALDTDLVQVQLTAPNGTLTLSTLSGLSFSFTDVNGTGVGDGTADSTMTFRGTRTSVNAALNGLVFTPSIGFTGLTTINIVTNDLGTSGIGGAKTAIDSLAVTVVNSVPTLTAISILPGAAEDTDYIITYAALAAAANAADANGDTLSFRVDSIGLGSTLVKNTIPTPTPVIPGLTTLGIGESLTWRGPANANGILVGFAVRAYDGTDVSSPPIPVRIDVSPQPDPPTLSLVNRFTGAINNIPFDITYSQLAAAANAGDVDGDVVSFRVESIGAGSTLTQGGTTVVPGTTQLNPGGTWTWTSDPTAAGDTAAFTIVAIDPGGLTSGTPITVTINVFPNQPPTLTTVGTLPGGLRNLPFSINYALLAGVSNEADPENDPLSFRIESVTQGTLTDANGGPVIPGITTLGTTNNPQTNQVSGLIWTPPAGAFGVSVPAFTVTAFDGFRASTPPVQARVQLTNLPPTLTTIQTLTGGLENQPFTISYATLFSNSNAADPNNDPISFRIGQVGNGSLRVNGQAVVAGTTLITTNDTVTWTPPVNQSGLFAAFSVQAFDGNLGSGIEVPVNIAVAFVPQPPSLTKISTFTTGFESLPFDFTYSMVLSNSDAADPDPGDVVKFRVESVLAGSLQKNGQNVVSGQTTLAPGEKLVWTPPVGTTGVVGAFTVKATDGRLLSANPITVNLQVSSLQAKELLRAYSRALDYHFYTTSRTEFDIAIQHGYEDESSNLAANRTGFAVPTVPVQGASAIHRLRNPNSGRHYYTSNTAEKDFLTQIGWIYERADGFIFGTQLPNTVEIFKIYNRNTGVHVYVDNTTARDAILRLSPTWELQTSLGFAFHVQATGAIVLGPNVAPARNSAFLRASAPVRLAHLMGEAPAEAGNPSFLPQFAEQSRTGSFGNAVLGQTVISTGLPFSSPISRADRINPVGLPEFPDRSARTTSSEQSLSPDRSKQSASLSISAVDIFWDTVGQEAGGLPGFLNE